MLEHVWEPMPEYEFSPYERRRCPVCHLDDSRNKDDGTWFPHASNLKWKVTTPCIEPVPEKISYHCFVEEVFSAVADKRRAQELVGRIRCIGVPGSWSVGIVVDGRVTYPEHKELHKDYEVGFAEVLRWLRARQFDPYKYSDLHYRERLADRSDCCAYDD
jgi:hypothetical protein